MNGPDAALCPPHLRESIDAYVQLGRETGSFLRAVLENDLREAIARADKVNVLIIPHVVAYLYNHVPAAVWGSPEAVARHLRQSGERWQLVSCPVCDAAPQAPCETLSAGAPLSSPHRARVAKAAAMHRAAS